MSNHKKTKSGNIKFPHNLPSDVQSLINENRVPEALELLCHKKGQTPEEERFFNIKRALLATEIGQYSDAEGFIALAKEGTKNYFYFLALNAETELCLKTGDYARGRACCEEVQLYGSADNKRNNVNYGRILEAEGNYAEAMRNYQIAAFSSTNYTIQKEANYHLGNLAYAIGDFETAETALKNALRQYKISGPIFTKLVNIYLRQGRYQEALDIVKSLTDPKTGMVKIDSLSVVPIIVAKKRGEKLPPRKSKSYLRRQIIEYRADEALAHIQERKRETSETVGRFSETVDVEQLFVEIKEQMTDENRINESICDVYEIDYPNAGYDLEDNLVHKIRVIAIPNTKDILTMYPSGKSSIKKQGNMQEQVTAPQKNKMTYRFNARYAAFQAKK